jgi:hypothetical protein
MSYAQTPSFPQKLLLYFFLNLFWKFPARKRQKEVSAKNSVSSSSFYPSVGSGLDKTSSKVIGKVNAYEMYEWTSLPSCTSLC